MTRWLVPLVAATVVVVDQAAKAVAVDRLGPDSDRHRVDLVGTWLAVEYAENRGVAFGLLRSLGGWVPVLAAAVLLAIIAVHARQPTQSPVVSVAIGLAVGGAVGNLVDRLRLGHVVDFVAVGPWPNFNVADSAITVGVTIAAVWYVLPELRRGGGTDERVATRPDPGTGGR